MRAEDQIFSLMAIAEEQQRLVTQSLERQERFAQALINQQQANLKEFQSKQSEVQREFERQVKDLNRKLSNRVGWSGILLTLFFSVLLGGIVAGGLTLYALDVKSELDETRQALRLLEGYNADVRTCDYNGKKHPCVRVMVSWGGQGTYKDYFAIDPKN